MHILTGLMMWAGMGYLGHELLAPLLKDWFGIENAELIRADREFKMQGRQMEAQRETQDFMIEWMKERESKASQQMAAEAETQRGFQREMQMRELMGQAVLQTPTMEESLMAMPMGPSSIQFSMQQPLSAMFTDG